jgi:hypothetical protein
MVERSVEGKQYKVTFYHGRKICVEGKQYNRSLYHNKNVPLYCFPSTDLSTIIKMYLYIVFLQQRSLYHNKNVPLYCLHFYYGREISAEGKQYKGTFLLW